MAKELSKEDKAAADAVAKADKEAKEAADAQAIADKEAAEAKEAAKAAQAKANKPTSKKGDTHVVLYDSITCMRGVLVKGQGCQARDFSGGDKQIASMVKDELIKKA